MPIHDWTRVNAGIFHHFHHEWISALSRALNAGVLPPEYYALDDQIAGGFGPDVLTLGGPVPRGSLGNGNGSASPGPGTSGGVVLVASPPRVRFTAVAEVDRYAAKAKSIAIRHVSGDNVVAVIEIVSPGNKSSRHGLRSFVDKAVELLRAGIHLLIIDLFPPGPRDPNGLHAAVWSEISDDEFRLPPELPLTLVSYSAGEVKKAFIEPVAAGGTLPEMPLFLEPDRHVLTPLEAPYQAAFDAVPKRWRDELTRSVA